MCNLHEEDEVDYLDYITPELNKKIADEINKAFPNGLPAAKLIKFESIELLSTGIIDIDEKIIKAVDWKK